MIMLAITAQCPYTFGPGLPTNFSKKGLILLSNLGPNPPSLIYFKFNKYILYSTYRQELQILLRLTYCIPCKHKITTFINILVINIHYDQGQSNFDGGYFFLSTHCISTLLAKLLKHRAPCYQIIGDNIDLHIKTNYMTSTNQNKDIHWFNLNAVLHRFTENDLSDSKPSKFITDMESVDFLPS